MLLLFDIGNTHTHLGWADEKQVLKQNNIPTSAWSRREAGMLIKKFIGQKQPVAIIFCSVVPQVRPFVQSLAKKWKLPAWELSSKTICGVGIDYPKPETIGQDRLANAIAVKHHFGAPALVVDFGTAVTFDVVDAKGNYVGGIIAPGLSAMTDYLHEKTALLPKIKIRETTAVIGKNTEQAMLIGAVHGYRGLIRQLISELKAELKCQNLPVVATGGCARLISTGMPEINAVDPLITLEGLRLFWLSKQPPAAQKERGGEKACYLREGDL